MLPAPMNPIFEDKLAELTRSFKDSAPVRHVVIDDFLDTKAANQLSHRRARILCVEPQGC